MPAKTKSGLTLADYRAVLECATIPNGGILLRPCGSVTFIELHDYQVFDALAELEKKIPLAASGIDQYTACEKLAFLILRGHVEGE